jgi:hypothetical protein
MVQGSLSLSSLLILRSNASSVGRARLTSKSALVSFNVKMIVPRHGVAWCMLHVVLEHKLVKFSDALL